MTGMSGADAKTKTTSSNNNTSSAFQLRGCEGKEFPRGVLGVVEACRFAAMAAWSRSWQQRLYFLPLPQRQGSLRPGVGLTEGLQPCCNLTNQ